MKEKMIAWGAEAELYLAEGGTVVKRRVQKKYRIPEIDVPLRKARTKMEAGLLHKAKLAGVRAPLVVSVSEFEIQMSFEKGVLLREKLEKGKNKGAVEEAGKFLARLHANGVVHGDYTPANVLVNERGEAVVIDFGLGGFSKDVEDKAVDVLLMKKALAGGKLFEAFWKGYEKECGEAKAMLRQVGEIEKRGRYVVRAMQR